MKREDLGKMLYNRVPFDTFNDLSDPGWQEAAEDFWNDVIDALIAGLGDPPLYDPELMSYQYQVEWLQSQKIGDDE